MPIPAPTLRGVRFLLVEDDQDSQDSMKLMLEIEGALVATAGSAAEGLRAFFTRRPDVLLVQAVAALAYKERQ